MMNDKSLLLSDAQAVTASAASESVVDTLAAGDAFTPGAWLTVSVQTAFTSNGATVQIELQTSTTEAFGTAITLSSTAAIPVATLVAKYVAFQIPIPAGVKRYLRAYYTVASGPAAGGKLDAVISLDTDIPPANTAFPA